MSAVLRLKGEGQEGPETEGMVAFAIVKAPLTLTELNVVWIWVLRPRGYLFISISHTSLRSSSN